MGRSVVNDTTIFAGLILCCLLLASGCVATKPPTSAEMISAQRDGQMLVLLRVAARLSTGESIEPFASSLADDNFVVAAGSFETVGELEQIQEMRYLSDESRAEGWFYIFLPKGTLYFAFPPPRRTDAFTYADMITRAKRWRVDAPTTAAIVYAGSLYIEAIEEELFFGGKGIRYLEHIEVLDETAIAKSLVQRFVPTLGDFKTVLIVEHEGPTILTTPAN